jgi:hypothetical protein
MSFKKVSFDGFDRNPRLLEFVQQSLPEIEDELRSAADRITLDFNLRPDAQHMEVEMTDDLAGTEMTYMGPELFDNKKFPDTLTKKLLRARVRQLHGEILDAFLKKQVAEMKKDLAEVSGV